MRLQGAGLARGGILVLAPCDVAQALLPECEPPPRAGLAEEALDARRSMLGVRRETERLQALMEAVERGDWAAAREADLRRELQQLLEKAQVEDAFPDVSTSRQASDMIVIVLAELGEWSRAMGGTGLSPAPRPLAPGADGPPMQPSRPGGRCPLRATAPDRRTDPPHLIMGHSAHGPHGCHTLRAGYLQSEPGVTVQQRSSQGSPCR